MTFPVIYHFGSHAIHAHQVLELLGYLVGFSLFFVMRKIWPVPQPKLTLIQTLWIFVGAIFGALIGARVLAWIENQTYPNPAEPLTLLNGKTIVGALLGGWVGVEYAKRFLRINYPSGDIYVFPLILGICIGRVGCFLEGLGDHTCGAHTTLPWAVDFGDGPRHPSQLYEILYLLLLGTLFLWRLRTHRQRGCMFSQFMFGYLLFRFGVEFLKDRFTIPYLHLSPIQLTSLSGMTFALLHWNDTCCGKPKSVPFPDPLATTFNTTTPQPAPLANLANSCAPGDCACSSPTGTSTTHELTNSLCPHCLQKIEAKIVIEQNQVFLLKFCPTHGNQKVLIADDAAYWRRARILHHHTPTSPLQRNTPQQRGCPWDCGLCPDHEQHTCLAIIEITEQCNLHCPICFAQSEHTGHHRTLAQIEAMLDTVVANEGKVGVVQISGGEPTLHPDFFAILDAAKKRPIQHLMINTNGLKLAEDPNFAARLKAYQPAFEVYLQFDSLNPAALQELRGRDLTTLRLQALKNLNAHNISTTLVVTLKKGVNDSEIGDIIKFAITQPCVRGITFQPIQSAGRLENFDPAVHRLTLTEVRTAILKQSPLFTPQDLVPVPCHADALAMAYALRHGDSLIPLSKLVDPQSLLAVSGNTICFEQDPNLRQHVQQLITKPRSAAGVAPMLKLSCCLPLLPLAGSPITYDKIFRIIIMQFMDAWSMDLRSLKRSCVHIASPDGKLYPFETYNLLHRPHHPIDNNPTTVVIGK